MFAFATNLGAVLYTLLMVTESLDVTIALSFCFGALNSIRINIGFVYLTELMPKSHHASVTSFWSFVEGSIYVLATIYFWQISNSWLYFVSVGYVL